MTPPSPARLRDGKVDLNEVQVDLRDIIDDAVMMLESMSNAQGIALQWDRPETPVVALVDQTAIRQIAINLVNSAVKYTAKGGMVTLGLRRYPTADCHSQ
ncbi:hypothetical protein [Phenylobacterium sp.]|uniref:sensor histidine kinase n=1 Tax=Phenylobacterium sp. TaxID=1871053 RepID=UPI0025D25676|nr:hypothetical protein [Phenylobacterium sp.]